MLNHDALRGKKVCITGATGFLGSHLLPMLVESGANVVCIVRKGSNVDGLPAVAKIAQCDLSTGLGLGNALAGQDILVHMASLLFGLKWQDYLAANSMASANIVRACAVLPESERPQKIVLVSSLAACRPCAALPGIAETALPQPVSAYGWSKLMSEKIFSSAFSEKLAIVRPPVIYGSGDKGLLPMFKAAARGIGASPGAFRQFPLSVIHARDAAQAIMLCMEPNALGIYHISDGAWHDMDGFCLAMGVAQGKNKVFVPHVPLPVMGMAAMMSTVFGIASRSLKKSLGLPPGRAPEWNLDKYRESRQAGWLADDRRIRAELGFAPQMDLAAGMREAVDGYRARGWL